MADPVLDDRKMGRSRIWQARGRRFVTGLNVGVSVVLALVVVVLINCLSARFHWHRDISASGYYRLSDKTSALLASLKTRLEVVAFLRQGGETSDDAKNLLDDVRNLLKEYQHEVDRIGQSSLKIEIVDPDRDLARTRELKQKYELGEANMIVFDCGGRRKYVGIKDIMDYDINFTRDGAIEKKRVAFKGEQVFSSAIQSVNQATQPIVYFLTGHGERDVADYRGSGYSTLAKIMRHDNIEVRVLNLVAERGVPDDCSAIVIGGSSKRFSADEISLLSKYLAMKGRILVMLDPAVVTGLEPLLVQWGVKVGSGVVVGLTLTGRELLVTQYGNHPITKSLKNVTTMFYMPRPVEPDVGATAGAMSEAPVDRPRVTMLALNTKEGWVEMDLEHTPARFDPKTDRPGPVPVAVAVEKGPVSGIDVELKPARMVVVGDSLFVANSALSEGAGGNQDFFLSSMNWLLEREALMAIAPKVPGELRLDMDRDRIRITFLLLVAVIPAFVAVIGFVVWMRRRA